ncbi:helix-turn-helix domain-containing protein [Ancylomarina sp.]|uniref:helix-turn-helix domain-containing protein n=1 Tax=Ancylomarina sp. TaxID=1970196 RepID=UPI0035664B5E
MKKYEPINEIILFEMKKQGLNTVDLSRRLNLSRSSTYYILSRPNIQIDRLWEICEVLQINFFQILSNQLQIENSDGLLADEEKEALKAENKTLKEVIKLLGSAN